MKKIIILFICFIPLVFACKKEHKSFVYNTDVKRTSIPTSYTDWVLNPDDSIDEKINKSLYVLSRGILAITKNQTISNYILTQIKSSSSKFLNISTIITAYPSTRVALDSVVLHYTNFMGAVHTYDGLVSGLSYHGLSYIPVINLPNYDTAVSNVHPYVAPGFELYDDDDTLSGKDDIIACTRYSSSYEEQISEMWEDLALGQTVPVYIVSLDCPSYAVSPTTTTISFSDSTPSLDSLIGTFKTSKATITRFSSCEFKIIDRYENSGRSEFTINATTVMIGDFGVASTTESNQIKRCEFHDNSNPQDASSYRNFQTIMKVDKGDINKPLSSWAGFSKISEYLNYFYPHGGSPRGFFNTYERDWYASAKKLGTTVNYFSHNIELSKARMKYSTDFYCYDPTVSLPGVDYQDLFYNWARYKSGTGTSPTAPTTGNYIRLWRVEI